MNANVAEKILVSGEQSAKLVRRLMLFFAMLLSGGNVAIPRGALLVLLLGAIMLIANPLKAFRPELSRVWLLLLVILFVSTLGAGSFDSGAVVTRYANFLGAIFILIVYLDLGQGQMMRDAKPILILFGIQSILTPILAVVADNFFTTFQVGDTLYHTLGFLFFYHEAIEGSGILGLKRANGFFFEPGVFQIYLNLLLYAALFRFRDLKLAALALAGVAATQSTMGAVLSCMICGLALPSYLRRMQVSTAFAAVFAMPMALLPVAWFTYTNIVNKLFGDLSGSTNARSFDAQTGVAIMSEHPIFGIGFSHDRFREEFRAFGRSIETVLGDSALERTMSNGVLYAAVTLGIPIAAVFLYATMRQRIYDKSVIVGAVIIFSMMTEPLLLTPFFLTFVFSGLIVPKTKVPAGVPVQGGRLRRAGA